MATHLRKHVNNEILLILNGILSILFALISSCNSIFPANFRTLNIG